MQCYCEDDPHFVTDKDGGDHEVRGCREEILYIPEIGWKTKLCQWCLENCKND